jgi:hypothetical protein
MAAEFGLKNNLFLILNRQKQIKEYDVRLVPRYISSALISSSSMATPGVLLTHAWRNSCRL